VKFSVWPSYDRTWDETLAVAQWAEQAGMDGFWYADHLMPFRPSTSPDDGDALECWTVLAAVGAVVPRVRLVSMVSPVTIHHPVLLTKRVVTADHVSGGRAVLGLGAGWQENEHHAYGFDLPAPGPRVDRFEEAIQVVRGLLTQERTSFDGQYYTVRDAPLAPKPVGPLPLLVGTGSPRMSRITARWADEWNTWGDPDVVQQRTDQFVAACEKVDRDPSTVRRSAQALVFLTDDDARRDAIRAAAPADRTLAGGPAELIDLIGTYVEAGIDEFAIPDFTLGDTPEQRRHTYARLRDEVLSAFLPR
jgi:alkanesulfonate monooxygenase SsuD/methylene tetrahydromethanopterin reductase-like flavin-dependent oxidoreductase (luciferase family)